jgi:hypothetical protein
MNYFNNVRNNDPLRYVTTVIRQVVHAVRFRFYDPFLAIIE